MDIQQALLHEREGLEVGEGDEGFTRVFSYLSFETWTFRRTLAYWISIFYMEGSLLFVLGAFFSIVDSTALDAEDAELALVSIPYFAGGIFFTLGAWAGCLELRHVTQVSAACLFSRSTMRDMRKAISWYGIVATLLYVLGALAFNVNTILGFSTLPNALVWFPAIIGSLGFTVGGVLECLRNAVFTNFKCTAGQWVSLTNAGGGLLFLIAAVTGSNSGLGEATSVWLVDFPYLMGSVSYLIGSVISLWMWKDEQYGLSKLPEINLGPRTSTVVDDHTRSLEQYGCGKSRASQLPFLFMYVANSVAAVMLLSISLSQKQVFFSFRAFYGSTIMDNVLNFALSHTILVLGSVIHHVPTAAPHSWILIMGRVILFFMTILSWARVVGKIWV